MKLSEYKSYDALPLFLNEMSELFTLAWKQAIWSL